MTGTITDAAIADYADWQAARCYSPNTIERHRHCLLAFARHARPAGLLAATVDHVEAWIGRAALAPNTRRSYLAVLQSFYRWAVRRKVVTADPTATVETIRVGRYLPRPISDADLALALAHADERMTAWLLLAALQGFRCQEIAGLQRDDILDDRDLLVVSAAKGGNMRTVPLHPETWSALRRHGLPRHGPVFRRPDDGPQLTAWTVSRTAALYFRALGVDATMHRLRHWFGTQLYRQERDLLLVRDLMGHASARTTEIYAQYADDRAELAIAQLALPE